MKKTIFLTILLALSCAVAYSQTKPNQAASPRPTPSPQVPQREATSFELSDYGVTFTIEPRLIIMMAALEAAGFRPNSGRR